MATGGTYFTVTLDSVTKVWTLDVAGIHREGFATREDAVSWGLDLLARLNEQQGLREALLYAALISIKEGADITLVKQVAAAATA